MVTYIWADGIYLAAGTEQEKTALLCVLGAREDGEKELIAMAPGYRESTESWAEALRDLRDRGLAPPLLAVGDGALGLWAALDQVFPNTEHQRCWNHRVLNVRSKLPKRLQAEVRGRLREMTESETQALCEERRDAYVAELRSEGQGAAAETVLRDWEDFATFYHYPMREEDLAWFIVDAVEQMELGEFYAAYREDGWGAAAYDPAMMVGVFLYAYCQGLRSSRRIAMALERDVGFRMVAATAQPDFRTICRFRAEHEEALEKLFAQVLETRSKTPVLIR